MNKPFVISLDGVRVFEGSVVDGRPVLAGYLNQLSIEIVRLSPSGAVLRREPVGEPPAALHEESAYNAWVK